MAENRRHEKTLGKCKETGLARASHVLNTVLILGSWCQASPHHPSFGGIRTRAHAHCHRCLLAAAWSTAGWLHVTAWTGVDVREVRPVSEGVYSCAVAHV